MTLKIWKNTYLTISVESPTVLSSLTGDPEVSPRQGVSLRLPHLFFLWGIATASALGLIRRPENAFSCCGNKNRWPTAKNFSSWSWPQARWWFETVFYFYPETLGKMKPFWPAYCQMGWNHQLARAEGHLDSQTKPSTKLPGIKKTVTWRPSDDHMATFFGT